MAEVPKEIIRELQRQREKWGEANRFITDDRWMEIATDEFNDLKWAVRTCLEIANHTITKERAQLIAVLIRWHEAAPEGNDD